jgi:aerobic carbon-monoxide dehydrogenase medium subunit
MKAFDYHKPSSVPEAAALFASGSEIRPIAGGMSLLPTMKQRLSAPSALIDLSAIPALRGISVGADSITIGAMTRHADVARSPEVQKALPALAQLAGGIGDPAVRNRGTIGGSLANNDPNADYPAAALGLGATIHTTKGKHEADSFFKGLFETALAPDEIITKVSFPLAKKAGYEKFRNQASRFALVGVFVSKRGSDIRVAVTGAGSNGVFRVASFEEALKKRFAPKSLEGLTIPATGMNSDIHGSAEYRAHLVAVMARRAVARANDLAAGEGEE